MDKSIRVWEVDVSIHHHLCLLKTAGKIAKFNLGRHKKQ